MESVLPRYLDTCTAADLRVLILSGLAAVSRLWRVG